jgi:hypothetical protein
MFQKTITWPDAIVTNYYRITQVVLDNLGMQLAFFIDFHINEDSSKVKSTVLRMPASGDLLDSVVMFIDENSKALVDAMSVDSLG